VNRLSKYVFATAIFVGTVQAAPLPSTNTTTTYHRVQVDGVDIFYREAGPMNAPTIVLLHGFPSSSREFDTLIPLLATKYHLIAPDYPGFGLSDARSRRPTTLTRSIILPRRRVIFWRS
jgi:pimeloyl-ACP methyl ester carboxylesterase